MPVTGWIKQLVIEDNSKRLNFK